MNEYYCVWLSGFLSAADKAFDIFQLEAATGNKDDAKKSLQRFTRGIHGAAETLRNNRQQEAREVD